MLGCAGLLLTNGIYHFYLHRNGYFFEADEIADQVLKLQLGRFFYYQIGIFSIQIVIHLMLMLESDELDCSAGSEWIYSTPAASLFMLMHFSCICI